VKQTQLRTKKENGITAAQPEDETHRHRPDSPFRGVRVKYVFPSWDAAYNPNYTAKAGFTHLLGDAKSKPAVGKRLEQRIKRDDPAYLHHCERIAGRMS
jgi:hypothetical protein